MWYLKSFIMEDKDPFMLHSQDHGCWWPGDVMDQDISSQGIDLVTPEYSGYSTRRVNTLSFYDTSMFYFNVYHSI